MLPGDDNVSAAVDLANMARRQIEKEDEMNVKVYNIAKLNN